MKALSKIIYLVAVLTIGLASCSKEKRIERQLTKKDGEWKITSLDYKYYQNNTVVASMNLPNAGKISFSKNGAFVLTLTLSGSPETMAGTWVNSDDEITISSNGDATVLKIKSGPKKGKMELESSYYDNSTAEKEVYVYHLQRED